MTAPGATGPRRRRWPLVVLTLAVLAAAGLVAVWQLIEAVGVIPVSLTVEGQEVLRDIDLAAMHPAQRLTLAMVVLFVCVVVLLVVPLALLVVVGAALVVALLPLMAVTAAVALLLSPLGVTGWLLWRAARPAAGRARPHGGAAPGAGG